MNVWSGSGYLTRDPEIKTITTQSGDMELVNFTVACGRKTKDGPADYIPCISFGKTAASIHKWFKKGDGFEGRGHLQTSSYDGKHGRVFTMEVVIEEFEFPKAKKNADSSQDNGTTNQPNTQPSAPDRSFMDIPSDKMNQIMSDLPFK